jgi:nitrous oxide reductase
MLHEQQPGPAVPEPGTVSRRKLIITGASLAAAGVAVGAAAAIPLTAAADDDATSAAADPKKPVMLHMKSAKDGTFYVFNGTKRIQITDRAFAARITNVVEEG